MGRLFGTDGVRGVAGTELTAELAAGLGRAAVTVLGRHGGEPVLVVGRDPRASGVWLEEALTGGIRAAGGDVILAGVEPTPAIAYMTIDLGASAGVVISASHNPAEDNGIKFFSREGRKLPDAIEDEIEAALADPAPDAAERGDARPAGDALDRYVDHLVGASLATLDGMRIVVDCANGSASAVAPALLSRLGADVTAINAEPDGVNINDGCGALHPEVVAEAVVRLGADAGVSHDGDADRALFASADGAVIDGDQVLAASAVGLHEAGELTGDTVVAYFRKITWPLCSPPRTAPRRSISSATYRSPTRVRTSVIACSRIARSKPMFDMTVATTVSPVSSPASCNPTADAAST